METLYSVRLEGLAANPSAPQDILLRILEHAEHRIRAALVHRAGVPDAVYDAVARHPDPRTRRLLAMDGRVPGGLRARLAGDPDPTIRMAVAWGPDLRWDADPLPPETVARLAADPDARVRHALCELASLPARERASLAADPDPKVRRNALQMWRHPPQHVVDAALGDPDPDVRRQAMLHGYQRRPELVPPLLAAGCEGVASDAVLDRAQAAALSRHERPRMRAAVAANPCLPADLVTRLAADPDEDVRLAVSLRPELTEAERAAIDYRVGPKDRLRPPRWFRERLDDSGLLRRCATSGHVGLRRFAAHSPHLPADLLALLARDDDFAVRALLAEHHPDAPGDLLLAVTLESAHAARFERLRHPNFPHAGLARLAGSPDPVARMLTIRDPGASAAVIERLSRDDEPRVRAAAAGDARLPVARVLELLDDPAAARSAAGNPGLPVRSMRRILYDVAIL